MLSSPHTPPHALGTLSPLPSRPARTPSTSPVLVLCYPRQKGLEPRCGGPPPPPYTSTTSSILLQVIDCEADALPLLWEINSGGGVNCGAGYTSPEGEALLLSVMVGVQGTILRRGAMHHSSHSQSQSQSHKGQGRVRICKVCGKESNKGPH